MTPARASLLAGAFLPLLSGCVVAAIPVLAAGGVLGTQVGGSSESSERHTAPRVSVDMTSPASEAPATGSGGVSRSYTLADGSRMEVMAGPLDPAASALAHASASAEPLAVEADFVAPDYGSPPRQSALPAGVVPDDGRGATIFADALPEPSGAWARMGGMTALAAFHDFSIERGTAPIEGGERRSAILAAPDTLLPTTKECSVHPAAVLIDLDPAPGMLDPAAAIHADAVLAAQLADLRAEGITIGWISGNTADRAGAVRRALAASGLDPEGRDEIALLRYPEERKQTRREDFAKEFCVVAIAGDDRSDFDELFQYLKDKSQAGPLDALIGNGWFLVPPPLS